MQFNPAVTACIETPERSYLKKCDLQTALQSIWGLIMATSGCPIVDHFKPMARFHLPFSTMPETLLRSVSFYLMEEFFRHKKGESASFDLAGLRERYEQVSILNRCFAERVQSAVTDDSNKNAISLLHAIGELLQYEFSDNLDSLEAYFRT